MLENYLAKTNKPLVVVLTGSGISAESGIPTFRDKDGLWEGYDPREVATPEAFEANPELVLRFYNERRHAANAVEPNAAHKALVELEEQYNVIIVTQNVDNLHERAGSGQVIHLHGEINKARSTADPNLIYDIGDQAINIGDQCDKGSQLRPHIVWFGEPVPMIPLAEEITRRADHVLVVGTSLLVYPAAGLIHAAPADTPRYVVNPEMPELPRQSNVRLYEEKATTGVPKLVQSLKNGAQA